MVSMETDAPVFFSSRQELSALSVRVGLTVWSTHQHAAEHGARCLQPAVWSRAGSQSDAGTDPEIDHTPFL